MSSNSASVKTRLMQETPNLLDPDAGRDTGADRNDPVSVPPVVKTREEKKTGLLDILGITKIIKLNQEHARVLNHLKRYQELEKQLDSLNDRMDKIIELLKVATGDGQKSVFMAAADKAEAALTGLEAMLNSVPKDTIMTAEQTAQIMLGQKNLNDRHESFSDLIEVTKNISLEINERLENIRKKTDLVSAQNELFWKNQRRLTEMKPSSTVIVK